MSNRYENPLVTRYASEEMLYMFSSQKKFSTWRRVWIALAESEKELGLPITEMQINELKEFQENLNLERAAEIEAEVRHDVMAHVHAYGEQCPEAKGIIHLGATSAFVTGNTDVIVFQESLNLVKEKLVNLINNLAAFSDKHKSQPTLGFTHFQPAQMSTVGKRATLWLMDLLQDYEQITHVLSSLRMRGAKGTTGTQASYLNLFDNDHNKVKELDKKVCEKLGISNVYPVTGQTYSRKQDTIIMQALSGIAETMHKMTNDIRLLQHLKEVEEPFAKNQIGSSAMAYKRNPMRSERIASLSRYVMTLAINQPMTTSTQWFERTLDDSAIRRLSIPEGFLAIDAILDIGINVTSGLVVYPKVIAKHINAELPFMATENIIMEGVKRGGDRQELHEKIRVHSMEASRMVKEEGKDNDLLERIANDDAFKLNENDITSLLEHNLYIGRSAEQVDEFISEYIKPILEENKKLLGRKVKLKV